MKDEKYNSKYLATLSKCKIYKITHDQYVEHFGKFNTILNN